MDHDILIEQLRSVYRISEGAGDPEALQRRFDEVAGRRLPGALDRAIGRVLTQLGLDPQVEVAIDHLAVRVRIRGNDVDDEALAQAWGRSIGEALMERLAPVAASGGGVARGVAIFADQLEAERAYLADRFAGVAEAWWHRQVIGRREGRLPSPRQVIERWIREAPEQVPQALAALLLSAGFVPGDVLSDMDAAALAEAIEGSRAERLRAIAEALRPARRDASTIGEAGSENDLAASGQRGAASGRHGVARTEQSGALTRLLASPERLRDLLNAREIGALAAAGGPGMKRLLLTCMLLARRPSMQDLASLAASLEPPASDSVTEQEAMQRDDARARDRSDVGEAPATQEGTPEATPARDGVTAGDTLEQPRALASTDAKEARAAREAARQRDDDTRDRAAAEADTGNPYRTQGAPTREERARGEHSIGCAGLLFLVRRVAASPLLDHHRGPMLEERLVTLGQIALGRALGLLPEGARRAAFERERPALAVFSGVAALPESLHALPEGPRAHEAAELLDALAAELPADLAPCQDGVLNTYGPDPDPFGPDHPDRAIAYLLLRPGRLVVTRTRADVFLPGRAVDVALRIGGWDIDPGFMPHLGRVIRFHYES